MSERCPTCGRNCDCLSKPKCGRCNDTGLIRHWDIDGAHDVPCLCRFGQQDTKSTEPEKAVQK